MIKGQIVDTFADAAQKAAQLQNVFVTLEHISALSATSGGVQQVLNSQLQGKREADTYQIQIQGLLALSPLQKQQAAYAEKMDSLSQSNITDALKLQEAQQAGSLAYIQAAHEITLADEARLRAANDNITSAQTQLETIGKSVGAAKELTFVQEQLTQAYEAAAASGVSVSQGYIDQIKKIGAEYGALQQKIAETQAMSDLQFAGSQFGRSATEQDVASQMHDLYSDDYLSHMDDAIANQVRMNDALAQFTDISNSAGQSFLDTFVSDMNAGQGAISSFTDAAVKGFDSILQKLEQIALNNLVAQAVNSLTGGGGSGTNLLSLFGIGGGSSAPTSLLGQSMYAKGGVNSGVAAYSNQILTQPTLFRFARGDSIGVAGEAGTEAIMPLTRGADGNLGVRATNDNSRGPATIVYSPTVVFPPATDGVTTDDMMAAFDKYNQTVLPQRLREIQADPRAA
jgi:lambda family phage tail tape measure protein